MCLKHCFVHFMDDLFVKFPMNLMFYNFGLDLSSTQKVAQPTQHKVKNPVLEDRVFKDIGINRP